MARQIGSGWRSSVSARAVMLVALVCTATLAFAVPAFADDDSDGAGAHSASAHRTVRDDDSADDTSTNTPSTTSNGAGSDRASSNSGTGGTSRKNRASSASGSARSDQNGPDQDADDKDGSSTANPNQVKGTPCTKTARACVDLRTQKAWLINSAGVVTTGPVKVSSGGPGEETPVGTFNVQWKDKNHVSQESKLANGQGAPMPYAVFFADGGVAFHGGSLSRASAGCVHLDDADAITFYNTLNTGDQVQVH
jgi:L,D-transpeptidase-like protein